jgi:polysaccharide export outer membrane protein
MTKFAAAVVLFSMPCVLAHADQKRPSADARASAATASSAPVPHGYTIGADDRLVISFWGEKDLNAEVVVRPDGRISLPLLNDVEAAGLTPDELRTRLLAAAKQFVAEPAPTVVVKEIHSRRVFITGNVEKPGTYPLNADLTVLQLIAMAGGLKEFVSGKNIVVVRAEGGNQLRLRFNYEDVVRGKNLAQNRQLRPGDTVIVP